MPFGYLVTVGLLAICTLLALVRIRRPRVLTNASFLLVLQINELPFVAMYLLGASTVLAFVQGDISSTGGWLAVAGALLTLVGLVVIAARGMTARPTIERAFRVALGDDWRASVDAGLLHDRPPRRRVLSAAILFAPFTFRRREVERIKNITYGPVAGKYNRLDVYRNRARQPGSPVLIHFHGGHFRWGNKSREGRLLFNRLASQGWVCVSANYRLGRDAAFPNPLIDAKRVIAWGREHGSEHGADPKTVFVAGSSAGGHMAAMAALTPNMPEFQPGFEATDTSVTAAIPIYGYLGPVDSDHRKSSPFDHTRPDRPSFFVVQGDHDTMVPVEQARAFTEELRRTSSQPVVYAELRGAHHSFDLFHSIRYEAVVDAIDDFTAWVRSQQLTIRNPARRDRN